MKFFSEGDKSKAICCGCAKLVSTRFAYRDVPFSDGSGVVKNILVGVCDHCDEVASVPAQSTPAISKAKNKATEAIEAVLPAPYFELLDLACFKINPEAASELRKGLLMFYVHRFATGAFDVARLQHSQAALALRPAMESVNRRRLSMKISPTLALELESIAKQSCMQKTEAIKAIIGAIQEDIIDDGFPELTANIQNYAVFAQV